MNFTNKTFCLRDLLCPWPNKRELSYRNAQNFQAPTCMLHRSEKFMALSEAKNSSESYEGSSVILVLEMTKQRHEEIK